jgi:hypothetical protein
MKKYLGILPLFLTLLLILSFETTTSAQGIYTARGYWEESNKPTYREIKQKQMVGDALSEDEISYLLDFETYLNNYYSRLSEEEKAKYEQMKAQWDRELFGTQRPQPVKEEFEWRGRDRAINIGYGFIYGLSLVTIAEIDNAAAVGLPLLTAGLWALGPVINPNKYKDITRPVLRASNTGKFLGLIYGASLGLMIGGDNDNTGRLAFGLATVGSIALGEVGFQLQKKNNYSEGHIELMRLYGIIGPWLGLAATGALGVENANIYGASLLAGGAAGFALGNKASQNYAYTKGDVFNVAALSVISTGLGFAIAAEVLENDFSNAILLIPAAGTVLGTYFGQKSVKGVYLTNKQGSTISYSTGGAALVGLGIAALTQSESPSLYIGLPSALALITQQVVFSKYKKENLSNNSFSGKSGKNKKIDFTVKVTPENYFINKQMAGRTNIPGLNPNPTQSLVNFKLAF